MASFEQAFRAELERVGGAAVVVPPDLAALLAALEGQARDAWPGVRASVEGFAARLARAVAADDDLGASLRAARAPELYLVAALAEGDPAALASFERQFVPELRAVLGRMGLAASLIDESMQVLRDELFVAREGAEPKIVGYAGRGHLRGWLRSVAGRTALRVSRQSPRADAEPNETTAPAPGDDLELAYLKRTYGPVFEAAFRTAFEGLASRDRLLLRQRLRHRLGVDELGALHGVDPSTASRWVTAARERLVSATREHMMQKLNVGRAEVSSILRLIQSQVDITITGWPEGDSTTREA